jgi:hypothetical protein|tara:strand:- start:623 stop:790 length:168 start_codon:yes stop_codon:yes gene_type:complete
MQIDKEEYWMTQDDYLAEASEEAEKVKIEEETGVCRHCGDDVDSPTHSNYKCWIS